MLQNFIFLQEEEEEKLKTIYIKKERQTDREM